MLKSSKEIQMREAKTKARINKFQTNNDASWMEEDRDEEDDEDEEEEERVLGRSG